MGHLTAISLRELISDKAESLRLHLKINFYPPLPGYVIEDTIAAVQEFWAGNRDIEALAIKSHMSNAEAFVRCHGPWLEDVG